MKSNIANLRSWRFFLSTLSAASVVASSFLFVGTNSAAAAPLTLEQITEIQLTEIVPNGRASYPSITPDGRYIAFSSAADNLVPDDTNSRNDVFLFDRQTGSIEMISVSSSEEQGDDSSGSYSPSAISDNGRYVAFESNASNFADNDDNFSQDIFLRDRQAGTTELISMESVSGDPAGISGPGPDMSADGRYITFASYSEDIVVGDSNGAGDIFVYDTQSETTEIVSVDSLGAAANDYSESPTISSDGRYVAFLSYADNLVGDDGNGVGDIFRHDRQTGDTIRVSVSALGDEGSEGAAFPQISGDGNLVSFVTRSSNLVSGDNNGELDVFVYDVNGVDIERVSVATGGAEQTGTDILDLKISSNGRYVSFVASAGDLVAGDNNGSWDAFVHDRNSSTTDRISIGFDGTEGNDFVYEVSAISDNGNVRPFTSNANNLLDGSDSNSAIDLFVRTESPADTVRVNADEDYQPIVGGDANTRMGKTSPDGRYVVFATEAGNLGQDENNFTDDIYFYDRAGDEYDFELIHVSSDEVQGNSAAESPSVSADGRYVVFSSSADNLVPDDLNGDWDIFLRDRQAGTTERIVLGSSGEDPNGAVRYPSMTADGRYVVFVSYATNLIPGGTNGQTHAFLYDRDAVGQKVSLISVDSDETEAEGTTYGISISEDGNYIVFANDANNLSSDDEDFTIDAFVRNVSAGTTELVSYGETSGIYTQETSLGTVDISNDGRYVTFSTSTDLLTGGDTNGTRDIYVRDTQLDTYQRASLSSSDGDANGGSQNATISGDGRYVVFESGANDIVGGDTNNEADVYMRDLVSGTNERISVTPDPDNEESPGRSLLPFVSDNGMFVAFLKGPASPPTFTFFGFTDPNPQHFDLYVAGYVEDDGEAPTVLTNPASNITDETADLNADITSIGSASVTTRGFYYGLTGAYGSTVSQSGSFGTGTYALNIAGLECNTTYHYQAFASNAEGTDTGSDGTFVTAACAPAPGGGGSSSSGSAGFVWTHPNGTLILHNGTIYLLKDRQRVGFRDAEEYKSYGYNFNQTVVANNADMALPLSVNINKAMTGSLVLDKSDGRTVYIIGENNTKRGFVSENVFFKLGYKYDYLFNVDLSDYPTGPVIDNVSGLHPEGSLVREDDPNGTVWWILDGRRYGFESVEVFNTYGFNFRRLVRASKEDLALTPGALVKLRDGTLVQDDGNYFIISDGNKMKFNSLSHLQERGYSAANLISTDIDWYTLGAAVR